MGDQQRRRLIKRERDAIGSQLADTQRGLSKTESEAAALRAALERIAPQVAAPGASSDPDPSVPSSDPAPQLDQSPVSAGMFAAPIESDWNETVDAFDDTGPENDPSYTRNIPSPVRAAPAPLQVSPNTPSPVQTGPPVPQMASSTEALQRAVDPFESLSEERKAYAGYFATRAAAVAGDRRYLGGFGSTLLRNHAPAKGHKKFYPDPDPLSLEADNKLIEPPRAVFDRALQDSVQHEYDQKSAAGIGMAFKLGEKKYQEAEGVIRDSYAERFRAWLRGNCSNIDHNNGLSSDPNVNSLVKNDLSRQRKVAKLDPRRARFERLPGVSDYLDSFVDAQAQFEQKLIKLQLHGPKNLDDAYLYYKYIVHGSKATPDQIMAYAKQAAAAAQL